jgi:O-antigen/teichoic acid export membrane protein
VPSATDNLLIRPVSVPRPLGDSPHSPRFDVARPALARGFWTLVDQAVVSLSNFITSIIIARACVPGELGLYDLGFTLVVLLSGVPKALIWSPYTAYQPHLSAEERARYTASSTIQVILLCAVAAAGLLIVGAIAQVMESSWFALLFIVLAPATALMILREHVRRLCLAWLRVLEVCVFDVRISSWVQPARSL